MPIDFEAMFVPAHLLQASFIIVYFAIYISDFIVKLLNWMVNKSREQIHGQPDLENIDFSIYVYFVFLWLNVYISTYLWSRWAIERWILAGCQSKVRRILRGLSGAACNWQCNWGPNFFGPNFFLAYLSLPYLPLALPYKERLYGV